MKKVFFKSMVGVAFVGMAMSSCVEVEDLYDPEYAAKIAEYRTQWVENFGEIDPNEDWGFGTDESSNAKALTRGGWSNVNGNQWGDYVEVPAPVTEEQKALVTAWFEQNQNPAGVKVNWADFFAQQVSSNSYGVNSMSELRVGEDGFHLSNFNGGDCGVYENVWNGNTNYSDKIMFVQGVGTSRFGYKCTLEEGANMYYDNYVIVPGENIDASLAGMYFLGFDFESNGTTAEKQIPADGYYCDWIIKVTPAIYKKDVKRIICEDLGTIGDFDFNDIVFDVYNDNGTAVVTLRAAGGTLPVTIGGVDVHKAFGVADDVMVNTNASNGVSVAPAIFRIPMPSTGNLNDIEVVVKAADAICVLKSPKGDAPQKICVTTDFVWPDERVSIKDVYPNFPNKDWAGSATDDEVKEEGDAPEGGGSSENNSEYGILVAAADLVSRKPIPAKYFANVGDACTITFIAEGVINGNLYGQVSQQETAVGWSNSGKVVVELTTGLLEDAKNGTLIFNSWESALPTAYIK